MMRRKVTVLSVRNTNACIANPLLSREMVQAIDIMKRIMRSQLETGVPFMFYRDEVNRMNPNKHEGMIYSSEFVYRNFSKYVTN